MGRPRAVSDETILLAARRCFLEHGPAVAATVIAEEVGVSHTTLFNRFGTKQGLMVAALGPPKLLPWKALLDSGPDDRPITEQFLEFGLIATEYFRRMAPARALLKAAGVSQRNRDLGSEDSSPVQAHKALAGWLQRAQNEGRIEGCDPEYLTPAILGALHGRVFHDHRPELGDLAQEDEAFLHNLVQTLWRGLKPGRGHEDE